MQLMQEARESHPITLKSLKRYLRKRRTHVGQRSRIHMTRTYQDSMLVDNKETNDPILRNLRMSTACCLSSTLEPHWAPGRGRWNSVVNSRKTMARHRCLRFKVNLDDVWLHLASSLSDKRILGLWHLFRLEPKYFSCWPTPTWLLSTSQLQAGEIS